MKYFICGGGTGGHINPAIAIAKAIEKKDKDAVVEFGGTARGLENKLVPAAGYTLHLVEVYGFLRKMSLKNIRALVKAYTSVGKAEKILKNFGPHIVIGTGGYASWPFVRAAARLNIPALIHEQNAFPGVTTKRLSRYADTVCISYEKSRPLFRGVAPEKLILTGNPITPNTLTRKEARKKLGLKNDDIYILSCGGSLGADKVNALCLEAMDIYRDKSEIRQIHAVGHIGWEKYQAVVKTLGLDRREGYEIVEYIYDMPLRQAAADIVVSRAGAITTAELAALGRATIFVPSPNVAEDHQYKNAAVLKEALAAEVFRESVLDGRILAKTITDLAKDGEKRRMMEEKMKTFGKRDAVTKITGEIFKLALRDGENGPAAR